QDERCLSIAGSAHFQWFRENNLHSERRCRHLPVGSWQLAVGGRTTVAKRFQKFYSPDLLHPENRWWKWNLSTIFFLPDQQIRRKSLFRQYLFPLPVAWRFQISLARTPACFASGDAKIIFSGMM